MGFDKDSAPRKPMLAARQITRAPLTPKIASTASNKPVSSPTTAAHGSSFLPHTVTVSTPLSRRATGPAANSTFASQSRDDLASPTCPPFPNSITPRSGFRQSRVDSGHTTPNGSPIHSERTDRSDHLHWDMRSGHGDERIRHGSAASGSPLSGHGSSANGSNNIEAKFFYARDVKSAAAGQQPSPPPMQRAPTFFYANGQSIPIPQPQQLQHSQHASPQPNPNVVSIHPAPHSSASTSSPDLPSKFIYANGDPDRPHGPAVKGPAASISSVAVQSKSAPTKTGSHTKPTTSPAGYVSPSHRPLSPVRPAPGSPFPLQKSGTFPVGARSPTSSPLSSPMAASTSSTSVATSTSSRPDGMRRQRSSAGTTVASASNSGHSRTGSLTIAEASAVNRLLQSSQSNSEVSTPSSSQFSLPHQTALGITPTGSSGTVATTNGIDAFLQAYQDSCGPNDESESRSSGGRLVDGLHSPTVQQDSLGNDFLDDLVTNARRDRKVQDLEITNASLEAINRSLERQLRKQKNELRNFRRLSRSGRLSMTPSMTSNRITSSSTVEGPLLDNDELLSGFSDDDAREDDDFDDRSPSDLDASLDGISNASRPDSPSSDNSSPALANTKRRRQREEKRIQLDLAKHRELLVDSQKINQSIKRCLSWTDELIEEGRKALAFQVRVSEIQIGGRVLAEDEIGEGLDDIEEAEREASTIGDCETKENMPPVLATPLPDDKGLNAQHNTQASEPRIVHFDTGEVALQSSDNFGSETNSIERQENGMSIASAPIP